jgi:hypothetical protein
MGHAVPDVHPYALEIKTLLKPDGAIRARQHRDYRERHMGAGGDKARLGIVWSVTADAQLRRLCRRRGQVSATVLEELVKEAERKTLDGMTPEQEPQYLSPVGLL